MLNTLEPEYSTKWRKYLQLKQHFYMAYVSSSSSSITVVTPPGVSDKSGVTTRLVVVQAYCYHGQTLLASDKCGEAIRSLQEAEKCMYTQSVSHTCHSRPGQGNKTPHFCGVSVQVTPALRCCVKSIVRPKDRAQQPNRRSSCSS